MSLQQCANHHVTQHEHCRELLSALMHSPRSKLTFTAALDASGRVEREPLVGEGLKRITGLWAGMMITLHNTVYTVD